MKPPTITPAKNSTRIMHREYVSNITSGPTNNTYSVTSFACNPGMPAVFPWLSGVARNWEKYKFHKLIFHYVPRCSTSTAGSVMMAFDYDSADADPVSDQTILSYDNCQDSAPWNSLKLVCPSGKLAEGPLQRFVRHAVLPSNLDIKTYDVGKVCVASSDCQGSTPLGRVFVDYDVELFIPQVPPEGPEFVASANVSNQPADATPAMPLGHSPVAVANSVGSFANDGVHNTLTNLVSGSYNLTSGLSGTALAGLQNPLIQSGPGTVSVLNGPVVNAGSTTALGSWILQGVGPATNIILPYLTSATAVTAANIRLNKALADVQFP